jgi:hypothetical protein
VAPGVVSLLPAGDGAEATTEGDADEEVTDDAVPVPSEDEADRPSTVWARLPDTEAHRPEWHDRIRRVPDDRSGEWRTRLVVLKGPLGLCPLRVAPENTTTRPTVKASAETLRQPTIRVTRCEKSRWTRESVDHEDLGTKL